MGGRAAGATGSHPSDVAQSARRRAQAGFTLLELMLVISLMALISGIYLGGFTTFLPYEIRTATRVLGAELEYASQRAVTTGELHRLVFDLDAQRFRLEQLLSHRPAKSPEEATHADLLDLKPPRPDREFVPVEDAFGEWRALDETSVRLAVVQVADQTFESGAVAVMFASDGGADPAQILLEDEAGRRMLLRVIAFSGTVSSEELPDA